MNVYEIINHNREAIDAISEDAYPNLYHLKEKTRVVDRLLGIMNYCTEECAYAAFPPVNPKYFIIPIEKISRWCKQNGNISFTPRSWQAAKVLLEDIGLLQIIHVRGHSRDPILESVFISAAEKGMPTCTLWGFPLYSDEVLQQAESVLRIYREARVSLTKITKTEVIRIRGCEIADKLYHGNTTHGNEIEPMVYAKFSEILHEAIERDGYIVAKTLIERLYDVFRDRMEEDYRYFFAIKKADAQKASLAVRDGYRIHPVTKADKETYGIAANFRKWIITR